MDTDIIVMNAASQVGPGAMREQTSKRLPTVYISNAFFLLIPTLIFLTEVIHAHIFFCKKPNTTETYACYVLKVIFIPS